MKKSWFYFDRQVKIRNNGLKVLWILISVGLFYVIGTLAPSNWGVSEGSAASPPQKMAAAVNMLPATPTPLYPIPSTEINVAPLPLPEINSLESEHPPLPESYESGTDAFDLPEDGQMVNEFNDLPPTYWADWSQQPSYRSACIPDLNKRSLLIGLSFPHLTYSVDMLTGQAWVYHQFWEWNQRLRIWESGDWTPPTTQYATITQPVFTGRSYTPNGIIGGPIIQHLGYPLFYGEGLISPTWIAIKRYTAVSRLNNNPPYGYYSWVTFANGSIICEYDFSRVARSGNETGDEALAEVTAPTPPPNSGSPNFAYLPMLRKPGTYNPAPTSTPFITPTAVAPPTPLASPIASNLANPDFDQGPDIGWTEYSSQGYDVIMNGPKGFGPRSGQYLAWLGGVHSDTSWISQSVNIPVSHPFLTMYLMASSQEDSCAYDKAVIMVDEYQVASIPLCKAQNFHSWLKNQIDLRDFAGQTVTFKVQVETDATLLSHLFVDDLVFESGVLIPTLAPTATQIPSDGLIRNPYFELGNNGDWGNYSVKGANNIFLNNGSHSGSWLAWLGGLHDEIAYIDQTVSIPADRPYLNYWWWISSNETTCAADQFWFIAGSDPVSGYYLCSPSNSSQWRHWYVDLSEYAGTTQRIRVQVQTNASLLSSLYLDDFTFTATAPTSDMSHEPGGQFGEFEQGEVSSEGISPDGNTPGAERGSKESKP